VKIKTGRVTFLRHRTALPKDLRRIEWLLPSIDRLPVLSQADTDRFWSKVDKTGPGDCWDWTAGRSKRGYGRFTVSPSPGVTIWLGANRVSHFLSTGIDLGERCACHSCDRPPCVCPDHIFDGTRKQNSEDMVRKGRSVKGDKHPLRVNPGLIQRGACHWLIRSPHPNFFAGSANGFSKLSEEQVTEIRSRSKSGETGKFLASEYGVTRACVSRIINNRTWKHI
jgi:hypothetical protein